MNESSTSFNYAGSDSAPAAPKSYCDSAYDRLRSAQGRLAELIDTLHANLRPVLRDTKPAEPGNVSAVGEAPQSEIHGRFLAAADRTEELAEHVELILSQVTV